MTVLSNDLLLFSDNSNGSIEVRMFLDLNDIVYREIKVDALSDDDKDRLGGEFPLVQYEDEVVVGANPAKLRELVAKVR